MFAQHLSVQFDLSIHPTALIIGCVKVTQVGTNGTRVCVKHDEDGRFYVALWDKNANGSQSSMVVYLSIKYIPQLNKHGIHYEISKSDPNSV